MTRESKTDQKTKNQKSNLDNYKRIASYLAPYKKSVIVLLLVVLFAKKRKSAYRQRRKRSI